MEFCCAGNAGFQRISVRGLGQVGFQSDTNNQVATSVAPDQKRNATMQIREVKA